MRTFTVPFSAGDAVRARGACWRIDAIREHGDCAALRLTGLDRAAFRVARTLLVPFDRPVRLGAKTSPRVVSRRRGLLSLSELIEQTHPFGGLHAAATARIELFGFQLQPALAIVRGLATRVLLADEVGLGKTIQAGLIISELHARGHADRVLVVVPPGMREQWRAELEERFGLAPQVLDLDSLAAAVSALPAGVNPWAIPGVTISSIDFVKRPEVLPALREVIWDALVLDEAHHLGPPTDRGRAARTLAERSRAVVLLTATPHSGDETAFSSLCGIGGLGHAPMVVFRRLRRDVGWPGRRRVRLLRVTPTAAEIRMHELLARYARDVWHDAALAASHSNGRSADGLADRRAGLRLVLTVLLKRAFSSAASLRVSLERRLRLLDEAAASRSLQLDQPSLPFDPDEEDPRDAEPADLGLPGLRDPNVERARLVELILSARAAARAESKLRLLAALLRRTRERMIVFTEYRDTLERVAGALTIPAVRLHGGLAPSERRAAAQRFVRGDGRVLLATDAAGEGLNLQQDCRLVVSLELPWVPTRLEQRIGRVDRVGQRRPVHAINLLARDTAESRVLARLLTRAARTRRALGRLEDSVGDPGSRGPHEVELLADVLDIGMTGTPPPTPAVPPSGAARIGESPAFCTIDLGDAAELERERLAAIRRLAHAGPRTLEEPGHPAVLPCIVRPRKHHRAAACPPGSGLPAGGAHVLIYRVSIHDGTSQLVEALVIPVAVPRSGPDPFGLRSRRCGDKDVKRRVLDLEHECGSSIRAHIAPVVRRTLDEIRQARDRLIHAWVARDLLLKRAVLAEDALARHAWAQRSLFPGFDPSPPPRSECPSLIARLDERLPWLEASGTLAASDPELLIVLLA